MDEKEIEYEFRLACVRACEKRGQPRPEVTAQADSLDDLISLGQKMLDEMKEQGIVWMYEEAITEAAHAIAERMRSGVVWTGPGRVREDGNIELLSHVSGEMYGLFYPWPTPWHTTQALKDADGQRVRVTVKLEGEDANG